MSDLATTMNEVLKLADIERQPLNVLPTKSVILRENERLEDCEHLQICPSRIRRAVMHDDFESFLDYLDEWAKPVSRVYISELEICLVVDHPLPDQNGADWEDHVSLFALKSSPEFAMWEERVNSRGSIVTSQVELALLFERRAKDVLEPDASSLLEMALTLEGTKNVDWKNGQRLKDGSVQLLYEETLTAKAGLKGELKIPDVFRIEVALFEGAPKIPLEVKLRYKLHQGAVSFQLEWVELEQARKDTLKALRDKVEAHECRSFLGSRRLGYRKKL